MNQPPLLTIGMPAYNARPYIRRTLEALLAQDFTDFELHISDDGSTDGTEVICREIEARDARVHYHRVERNGGATANFNRAFGYCHPGSEYFAFAADDDVREPRFLSKCVAALQQDPSAVMAFSYFDTVNPDGSHGPEIDDHMETRGMGSARRLWHVLAHLHWCSAIYGVMRARALGQTRGFQNVWGMDVAVMYQLAVLGTFAKVPEILFHRQLVDEPGMTARKQWEGFHPSNKSRRLFRPRWWLFAETFQFLTRLPVPPTQKLVLVAVLLAYAGPYRLWRTLSARPAKRLVGAREIDGEHER